MKLILKKKSEKKNKNKNIDKIKHLDIELVKIKQAGNPNKLQSELKELAKIHVVDKILHEIKNEIILDFDGEFKMAGKLTVGDQIRETHVRYKIITDD